MAKTHYQLNRETLYYEKVTLPAHKRVLMWLGRILATLVWGGVVAFIVIQFIGSPKEMRLQKENADLLAEYNILNMEIDRLGTVIQELENRDDNIYRVIFEAEPIASTIRHAGSGGSSKYSELRGLNNSELLISTNLKLDELKKATYIQSKSYDEIEEMLTNKIDMLASIPAILPVSLKGNKVSRTSGYGYRIHPIYKTNKLHTGIDFAGPTGTPIYATGNGKVTKADYNSGYGKHVVIDHGYSYKTHYAHMSAYTVKVGQEVKRGDLIGFIGSTGQSTGPHCHYEVLKNDVPVNPINYFFNDLTPDEYEELVNAVGEGGQSMD